MKTCKTCAGRKVVFLPDIGGTLTVVRGSAVEDRSKFGEGWPACPDCDRRLEVVSTERLDADIELPLLVAAWVFFGVVSLSCIVAYFILNWS